MELDNYLDLNLALLARRQPELADRIRLASLDSTEILQSAKGLPTARYRRRDGAMIPLHSRYDPMQEARRTLGKIDFQGADYFVLLGFGLGYNLDALLDRNVDPEFRYFVIESELEILKAALQSRNLHRILALPHIHFAWPPAGPDLGRQWADFFDPVHARRSVFISHAPALAANPELFKSAAQVIQSQTFQIFTDINTLVVKIKVFLDNFIENLPLALASPGISAYRGKFTGLPAVIVSAGPSLDRNIHELRGREERLLILATDTSLKPLLSSGVKPHFVLSGDPSYENYLHLRGAKIGNSLLVAEATCYPEVFREFRGRSIACTFENSSLRSLSALLDQKGALRAWGSVATMALDFALLMGCDPVIFVGQDLAHTDGKTYCSRLHWQDKVFADVCSPEQWQVRWEELCKGKTTIRMPDILGNPVETTDKLAAYWNWFVREIQSHPETHFVNATEGGILRDGVTVISLREALYRFCSQELALSRAVLTQFEVAQHCPCAPMEAVLAPIKSEARTIRELLSRGKSICDARSHQSRRQLLHDLEVLKSSLYANPHLAPLLDSFNQMGNVAFLRSQALFKSSANVPDDPAPIQKAYSEYFVSVLQALEQIESALARLDRFSSSASL